MSRVAIGDVAPKTSEHHRIELLQGLEQYSACDFIDRRFVGVRDQPERYLRALHVAQYHRERPAMESVFVEEGVVTVVIKK